MNQYTQTIHLYTFSRCSSSAPTFHPHGFAWVWPWQSPGPADPIPGMGDPKTFIIWFLEVEVTFDLSEPSVYLCLRYLFCLDISVYFCFIMLTYVYWWFGCTSGSGSVDLSLVRFGIRLDTYNFSLKHVIFNRCSFGNHDSVDECNKAFNKQYWDFMRVFTDHSPKKVPV